MPGKKPGAGPASRISREQILLAARRFYLHGHTQAAIAKDFGISAGYMARLLQQAREQGWIQIFVDADRETELAAALQEKYPHLVANRFLDAEGREFPLADGVTSYDPGIPTETLRPVIELRPLRHDRKKFMVLDAWGFPGLAAKVPLRAGVVNVLLCDSLVANATIRS